MPGEEMQSCDIVTQWVAIAKAKWLAVANVPSTGMEAARLGCDYIQICCLKALIGGLEQKRRPHQGDLDTERRPRRRQRRQGTHQVLSSKVGSRAGSRAGVGEPGVWLEEDYSLCSFKMGTVLFKKIELEDL